MTQDKLNYFFKSRLLLTLLLSCFFTVLVVLVVFQDKSHSLEGSQGVTIMAIAGFIWAMLLSVCSVCTFLNLNAAIRNNVYNRIISYYWLPVLAVCVVAWLVVTRDMWLEFLAMTAPFFVVHTCFFIQFNKRLNTPES